MVEEDARLPRDGLDPRLELADGFGRRDASELRLVMLLRRALLLGR